MKLRALAAARVANVGEDVDAVLSIRATGTPPRPAAHHRLALVWLTRQAHVCGATLPAQIIASPGALATALGESARTVERWIRELECTPYLIPIERLRGGQTRYLLPHPLEVAPRDTPGPTAVIAPDPQRELPLAELPPADVRADLRAVPADMRADLRGDGLSAYISAHAQIAQNDKTPSTTWDETTVRANTLKIIARLWPRGRGQISKKTDHRLLYRLAGLLASPEVAERIEELIDQTASVRPRNPIAYMQTLGQQTWPGWGPMLHGIAVPRWALADPRGDAARAPSTEPPAPGQAELPPTPAEAARIRQSYAAIGMLPPSRRDTENAP